MRWRIIELHTCLNLIGAVTLLVGLGSAVYVYRTAGNESTDVVGYDEGGGSVYPEDSKKYLRDLELYGGKANVLADELRRWFIGLWHGKSLALTLACIAIIVSSGFFYAAHRSLAYLESDKRGSPE
jgi:hypothetical protein